MSVILDDVTIRKLKATGKEYSRREKGGFGVRVLPSGRKVFFFLYRVDGVRRFLNLGEYKDKQHPNGISLEDARKAFTVEKGKVTALKDGRSDGLDPVKARQAAAEKRATEDDERRKTPTVADLITEYLEKHAKPSKKSWQDDERILNKDALVAWGKRKAADIKKRDVVLLLESIVDRGSPGSANNNFKIIRKMFRFAVQRDILQHSPCDGVVMPAPLNRGERVLSEAEIKTFWQNLDKCHAFDETRRAIRLILVTAQRPGEVTGMHSSEIEGRWWTISAERSKNKKAHRVYLTDTALELIGPHDGDEFIFPCTKPRKKRPVDGAPPIEVVPHSMWRQATAKVIKRNLAVPVLVKGKPVFDKEGKPVTENKLGISDFTPHDLRRTAATCMSKLGFMDEVIDSVLNHAKQGIIATYNLNRYDKEKQMALESWERKLLSIITSTQSNVIPITAARKTA